MTDVQCSMIEVVNIMTDLCEHYDCTSPLSVGCVIEDVRGGHIIAVRRTPDDPELYIVIARSYSPLEGAVSAWSC